MQAFGMAQAVTSGWVCSVHLADSGNTGLVCSAHLAERGETVPVCLEHLVELDWCVWSIWWREGEWAGVF